jgi:hypothetical protein
MPFLEGGAVKYCGFCRFPKTTLFHDRLDSSAKCFYNDFLNRTAWALWHNPDFHRFVHDYSKEQPSSRSVIDIPTIGEDQFKKWLLQEARPGMTHLFALFAQIVNTEGECPASGQIQGD